MTIVPGYLSLVGGAGKSSRVTAPLDSLAERAWYAFHCLPRGSRTKKPTPPTVLEKAHGLPRGSLGLIFSGTRTEPRLATRAKLAEALQVTEDWLIRGTGTPPTLTGLLPPRPRAEVWETDEEKPVLPLAGHRDWPLASASARARAIEDGGPPIDRIDAVGHVRMAPQPVRLTAKFILAMADAGADAEQSSV